MWRDGWFPPFLKRSQSFDLCPVLHNFYFFSPSRVFWKKSQQSNQSCEYCPAMSIAHHLTTSSVKQKTQLLLTQYTFFFSSRPLLSAVFVLVMLLPTAWQRPPTFSVFCFHARFEASDGRTKLGFCSERRLFFYKLFSKHSWTEKHKEKWWLKFWMIAKGFIVKSEQVYLKI